MGMPNITNKRGLVFSMHKVGSSTVMQAFREIGTIPIYWGSPKLEKFFNTEGWVQVGCFEDIELALKRNRHYLVYLDAINENFRNCRKYAICEDWIYEHYPELF